MTLAVSEIFGPVLQGEGPDVGKPTIFLRLMGCNLACSWCDTPYTWDASRFNLKDETTKMTVQEVSAAIGELAPKGAGYFGDDAARTYGVEYRDYYIDISGGEPMLQQRGLQEMLEHRMKIDSSTGYASAWPRWTIETAGTLFLNELDPALIYRFNVSPKLEHSGNLAQDRYKPRVLQQLNRTTKAIFKFVAQKPSDLDEVQTIVSECDILSQDVYIMPEGRTADEVLYHTKELEEAVLQRRWIMTTRLQILLHGDKRGT